jgi:fructosamine-3-kinase
MPLEDLLWYEEKRELGHHFLEQSMEYSLFTRSLIRTMYLESILADDLDKMREMIINNTMASPSVVHGTIWFDNMTEYINILKYIQDKLAERIAQVTYVFAY